MGGCAFCVAEDGAGEEKTTLSPADFPAAAPWWRRARGGQASSVGPAPVSSAAAAASLVWVGAERDRGFGSRREEAM
jgi:hypothetical protein